MYENCRFIYIYVYVLVGVFGAVCVFVCAMGTIQWMCTDMCMYIYMCVYICAHACVCVYRCACLRLCQNWVDRCIWSSLCGCLYAHVVSSEFSVQGGKDAEDTLSSYVIFRKRALYLLAFWRKETCNTRHPMHFHHPILPHFHHPVAPWNKRFFLWFRFLKNEKKTNYTGTGNAGARQGYITKTRLVCMWAPFHIYGSLLWVSFRICFFFYSCSSSCFCFYYQDKTCVFVCVFGVHVCEVCMYVRVVCVCGVYICEPGVYVWCACMWEWCVCVVRMYVKMVCICGVYVSEIGVYVWCVCMWDWCVCVVSMFVRLVCMCGVYVCETVVYVWFVCMWDWCVYAVCMYVGGVCKCGVCVCGTGV